MISVETVDDILFDAEGSRRADGILTQLPTVEDPDDHPVIACARPEYGFPPDPRHGSSMIASCLAENRSRYRTILHIEKLFPEDGDRGMLIVPACQILETELHARLLIPAALVCRELAGVLRDAGDQKQATLLEKWGANELPATIGICCIVTLALYRAVQRSEPTLTTFLQQQFRDPYLAGFQNNRLGRALDRVRTTFRNPACHGAAVFDGARYAEFVNLLVTTPTFNEFDARVIESDEGLLVTHLLHYAGIYYDRFVSAKRERHKQLCDSERWGKAGKCPQCDSWGWDGRRCLSCYHGMSLTRDSD